MAAAEIILGVLESVNDKGIRLVGRKEWLNFSKFAKDLPPAAVLKGLTGQQVAVTVDKDFVMSIALSYAASPDAASSEPTGGPAVSVGSRERTITRLSVLKAAVELAAANIDAGRAVDSDAVLLIAAKFEQWANREE